MLVALSFARGIFGEGAPARRDLVLPRSSGTVPRPFSTAPVKKRPQRATAYSQAGHFAGQTLHIHQG